MSQKSYAWKNLLKVCDQSCLDISSEDKRIQTDPRLRYLSKLHSECFLAQPWLGKASENQYNFPPPKKVPKKRANFSAQRNVVPKKYANFQETVPEK